ALKRLAAGESCRSIARTMAVHHATVARLAGESPAADGGELGMGPSGRPPPPDWRDPQRLTPAVTPLCLCPTFFRICETPPCTYEATLEHDTVLSPTDSYCRWG